MLSKNIILRGISNFFRTIWAIWATIGFFLSGLVTVIAFFFIFKFSSEEKAYYRGWKMSRWWVSMILLFPLVRYRTIGKEKIDKNQNYVFVSNHLSMMDIPVSLLASPVPTSFLAKVEVDKVPLIGYITRRGHVYVDRKSATSRYKSFMNMKEHLEKNRSIHIYVEGTRNTTDQPLKEFHDGAFKVAIMTQKPIAVLTLKYAHAIVGKGFKVRPGKITAVWAEPISTIGMTDADIPALKEKVRNIMLDNLAAMNMKYQLT